MLWKKGWWETRWLFLIGLAVTFLLYGLTYGLTFGGGDYDAAKWTERLQRNASLSESERQALNNYQGHMWVLWFRGMLSFIWADFAVILGALCLMTACPYIPSHGAAGLFTFSMPVSRRKVLLSSAAIGFGEMFLIALIP